MSSSNEVVLSADDQGATAFQPVECLADDSALHECVSLMDANRSDWYVRHRDYFLRVEEKNSTDNIWLFKGDSSYIVHAHTFYPGHYALESLSYRRHYISWQADGRLRITWLDHIANLHDASFRVVDMSCTYFRFVCL